MNTSYIIATLLSLSLITTNAHAAELVDLSQLSAKSLTRQAVVDVTQDLPVMLGASSFETLKVRSQSFDGITNHIRYFQSFRGIQLWPQELAISVQQGRLHRLNGVFVKSLATDIKSVRPKMAARKALEIGKALFATELQARSKSRNKIQWLTENESSDLRIYVDPKDQTGKLVYIVSFFADVEGGGQPHRPLQVIDANTGSLIKTIENLNTAKGRGAGGNLKTGRYDYGKEFPEFNVTQSGTKCSMTMPGIKTIDLKNGVSGSTAHAFKCSTNTEKVINGAYGPLNDAHYFAGVISGLYKDWYKTAPLKIPITMRVHYSTKYENAFWNGTSMTFGDGDKMFYPLVSLDVSSHEIAHGFTEFNSNLIYEGQSGGINEAFSDMAGEAADFYSAGKNDFQIGADIFKAPGRALRYMFDPPKDGKSIDHASKYVDGIDVHYSSGVYNKAFYLLANTKGWGVRRAFDVFVKANQLYWTTTTNYSSGAKGVRDAAADLGYATEDVVEIFAQVGINI
jgi:Zn-dependent metalloprotease